METDLHKGNSLFNSDGTLTDEGIKAQRDSVKRQQQKATRKKSRSYSRSSSRSKGNIFYSDMDRELDDLKVFEKELRRQIN